MTKIIEPKKSKDNITVYFLTEKDYGLLVIDNRSGIYYFDRFDCYLRNFETILFKKISRLGVVSEIAKREKCDCKNIKIIYRK